MPPFEYYSYVTLDFRGVIRDKGTGKQHVKMLWGRFVRSFVTLDFRKAWM